MPEGLIDLGNGIKQFDSSTLLKTSASATDRFKDQLGLVNLIGTIEDRKIKREQDAEDRPYQQQKMKVDLAISTNQLLNVDVDNLLKRAQLNSSVNQETRQQTTFFIDNIGKAADLFKTDPVLGAAAMQKILPNATFQEQGQGSGVFKVRVPTGPGKEHEFMIDPNKIADPKDRRQFEEHEREDFSKSTTVQWFKQQSQAFRNMQSLANQASGAGDVGLLYNYMKLLDPNSTVREGEVALAKDTVNIPASISNLYNKAITTNAPVFGDKPDSTARTNMIKAAKVLFSTALDDTISLGQNTYSRVNRQGLDGYNSLVPAGGLEPEDFLPTDKLSLDQQKASYLRRTKLLEGK